MKYITNIIANRDCLQDYCNKEKLNSFLEECNLDGYEVICADEYPKEIDNGKVIGLHLPFYNAWMDLYKGNYDALDKEYGSRECWQQFYGGSSFESIYKHIESQLDFADKIGVQYVVMHICEIGTTETLVNKFAYTHEQVIDASCEIINRLFKNKNYKFALLMENLWWQGLTFTDPMLTKRLLNGVEYHNKGIMLDIGHLMHTNKNLQNWQQAAEYIHKMLDAHKDMLGFVKGVHLHGTLEGKYAKEFYNNPVEIKTDFWERFAQAYEYVNRVDAHRPFADNTVKGIIEKINPDFLVYELQDKTMEQRKISVKEQNKYMQR